MIKIDKYRQLLLENRGRPANCFLRIDGAISLQINDQLVQIGALLYPCAFHGIGYTANRAEGCIQLQTSDRTGFIFLETTLICRLIAAATCHTKAHVHFTVFTQVTDHMIRVGNLNIMIQFDITGCNDARTLLAQRELSVVPTVHLYRNALEIQQNLNNVLLDTLDCAVLVQDTVNLRFSYGAARHRRQENSTQRASQSMAKTSFQRLKP